MLDIIGNPQNNKNYIIKTNGLLFDIHKFVEPEKISSVFISIGAATADTYAKVRGGDFNLLISNLKSIRENTPIMKTTFTVSKLFRNRRFYIFCS